MNTPVPGSCRRSACPNPIPAALANEQLCLEHFLDDAFLRTDQTFGRCREGRAMNPADVEWQLSRTSKRRRAIPSRSTATGCSNSC